MVRVPNRIAKAARQQRGPEGGVVEVGVRSAVGQAADDRIVQQHGEAGGDRLQLQRDVRHHADHGDDGDQAGQRGVLAVARADEVGDGGDAVGLADAQDLAQQQPAEAEDERRPQIDRQEGDAAMRGPADAAVEGPGGAVDRDRQRVDNARIDQAAALIGALVAVVGDGEQQADIARRDQDDEPAGDHAQPSASRRRRTARRSAIQATAPMISSQATKM